MKITQEPGVEEGKPGGRVVGANQKESFWRRKFRSLEGLNINVVLSELAVMAIVDPSITQKKIAEGYLGREINKKTSTFSSL